MDLRLICIKGVMGSDYDGAYGKTIIVRPDGAAQTQMRCIPDQSKYVSPSRLPTEEGAI